jgi:hypothetical protein
MVDFLWMDEDELRWQCNLLLIRLYQSEAVRVMQQQQLQKVYETGYEHGVTDTVVRIALATEERDACCHALH